MAQRSMPAIRTGVMEISPAAIIRLTSSAVRYALSAVNAPMIHTSGADAMRSSSVGAFHSYISPAYVEVST